MKRWQEDTKIMRKQKRIWESNTHGNVKSLGRFRKRHALDCGKAGCRLCHSEKILGHPRRDEQLSDLDMKDQVNEL